MSACAARKNAGPVQAGDKATGREAGVVRGAQLDAPGVAEDQAGDRAGGGDLLLPADAQGQPGGQREQHRRPAPEGERGNQRAILE